ncbi:uncharacterized protein LOC144621120 [Crassostrea virginica]
MHDSITYITISILDVNDQSPKFTKEVYSFNVTEAVLPQHSSKRSAAEIALIVICSLVFVGGSAILAIFLAKFKRNKIKDGVTPTEKINKMTLDGMESSTQSNTEGEGKNIPDKDVSQTSRETSSHAVNRE